MTGDVRSVLTDTLRGHQYSDYYCVCTCQIHPEHGAAHATMMDREDHPAHVADVLLGLSGVAVTQLPEPEWRLADGLYKTAHFGDDIEVFPGDKGFYGNGGIWYSPDSARQQAAYLLAASRVAEQHQDQT